MKFHTSYLHEVYSTPERYKALIDSVVKRCRALQKSIPFDAIAFRGTSGAAVAYPVALRLGISLICVRRENEGSHHWGGIVEGSDVRSVKRYIVIDDFISTGQTMDAILDAINDKAGNEIKFRISRGDLAPTDAPEPRPDREPNRYPTIIECVAIVLYMDGMVTSRERNYRGIPLRIIGRA